MELVVHLLCQLVLRKKKERHGACTTRGEAIRNINTCSFRLDLPTDDT
jgi:hypothetical protein